LPSTGNKAELVSQLTDFDPNIWASLNEQRVQETQDLHRFEEDDDQIQDEAIGGENGRNLVTHMRLQIIC